MKKMTYKIAKRIIGQKLIRAAALIIAAGSLIKALDYAAAVPSEWGNYVKCLLVAFLAAAVAFDKDRYLCKTHNCRPIFYHK